MIETTQHRDFVACLGDGAASRRSAVALIMGVLRRVGDAIFDSRERQAEHEIARILAGSGGRLTDGIEREMMQRLSPKNWGAPE